MGATTADARPRWWQRGKLTIEGQTVAFAAASLDFSLDEQMLEGAGVVVFRGELRRGDRRTEALVVYPPAFDLGEQPLVVAPGLEVGRHRTPGGLLCLDHVLDGESAPMSGAEAVQRAERLWELWETDRQQLADEEADAAEPWANYVDHTPDTALTLVDVDVAGHDRGYIHFGLTSLAPMRGAVRRVSVTQPGDAEIEIAGENGVLAGPYEVAGPWMRLPERPSAADMAGILRWLRNEHQGLVDGAVRDAAVKRDEQPQLPALVGFVYPDEGPGRGQTYDAWLFVVVRPDGGVELPRPFAISSGERWLRQPQLAPLAQTKVAVVGAGALGSQVAGLLARAGVGAFVVIDSDIVTPGNRVRHELDLADIGRPKAAAVGGRIRRINPWATVTSGNVRIGTFGGVPLPRMQHADDELAALLGGCDVIVNATASGGTSAYLSAIAAESGTPMVHAYVSAGAWGARILVQRPGESGCWDCLAWWQADQERGRGQPEGSAGEQGSVPFVPPVAEEHEHTVVMERGCADPTFAGPGFELAAAASAVARATAGIALDGEGYPAPGFDLATLRFHGPDDAYGAVEYSSLPVHERCATCHR